MNDPAVVNIRLNVAPGFTVPEFHEPSSPVDVCATPSVFVHVTVSPTAIAIGFGAYALFVKVSAPRTIETGVPAAVEVPPVGDDGE